MNYQQLIYNISDLSQGIQQQALLQTSYYLNVRNWLIGYYIVEFEQHGEDRATYGSKLLKNMAQSFKENNTKGLSFTNLNLFRQFYQSYPYFAQSIQKALTSIIQTPELSDQNSQNKDNSPIGQTPDFLSADTLLHSLTFSHFTELVRISEPLKRLFYEVQTIKNKWATRELSRQIGSLLYERTGLSKDKASLIQQVQQQSETLQVKDIIKDPFVLEFTGLPQANTLHENDLEQALIDNLQEFLLELGKGFAFVARQYRMQIDMENLFVSRYMTSLPTETELAAFIQTQRQHLQR